MPTFVYPSLLWGMLIVAVPVLIHLINMMRHRRVRWAAMDFLLASQKKNRAWVLLKQLLLLLLRMAIVAAVVAAVAQPLLRGDLAGLLGRGKTHHIVLLDDSFSMSDRWADTSAMERAKDVVQSIATTAVQRSEQQAFTLLRFSQAGQSGQGTRPDMLEENVDTQFDKRLAKKLEPIRASLVATGPLAAIQAVEQLLGESDEERRVVYLVSDFRRRNWAEADEIRNRLEELSAKGTELRLVNCVETARANLAISDLRPAAGTRAAGVPLFMEVTVENFGDEPARGVSVVLEEDGHSRPAVKIAEIPAGKSVKQRFGAGFPTAGEHRISARLAADAVAADNLRWAVVDLPADVPVLIIDGGAEGRDGWFLSAALSPGGPVRTGISARVAAPRFLSHNSLDEYDAIYLANTRRLEPAAIEALEAYVAGGGGLAFFLGEQTRSAFVNEELFRKGEGVFPLPLGGPAELQPDRLQQKPDLEVASHPLFEIFKGKQNSFLATVDVYRYFRAASQKTAGQWKPDADSGTEVIGRLRNGEPLIVQSRFGKGRVVTFLTTAAPAWNNWARNNPSFVVVVQELQSHIARRPGNETARNVGMPLKIEMDADDYNAAVRFMPPVATETDAAQTGESETIAASAGVMVNATPDADGVLHASLADTNRSGIYEVQLTKADGGNEVRHFAVNVDADEGDLQTITAAELAERLEGIDYQLMQAADLRLEPHEQAGRNLGDLLLGLLVLMLVGEQILAWSASYHPPLRRPTGDAVDTKAAGRGGTP
jgi:hypothetical protein